jgi:hypothetical protein
MYRRRTALAVSAAAIAAVLGFPPGAGAATRAPIRAYTEQTLVAFTGGGSDAGYVSGGSDTEQVALLPHVALADNFRTTYDSAGVHLATGQVDIVGARKFVRNGAGRWTILALDARALGRLAQDLSPYVTVARFDALPGIRRVGTRHYRVSGSYQQVGTFLAWQFGLTANSFAGRGITTLSIDLILDTSGRPVSIAAAGHSPAMRFVAAETFARYNQPESISAP